MKYFQHWSEGCPVMVSLYWMSYTGIARRHDAVQPRWYSTVQYTRDCRSCTSWTWTCSVMAWHLLHTSRSAWSSQSPTVFHLWALQHFHYYQLSLPLDAAEDHLHVQHRADCSDTSIITRAGTVWNPTVLIRYNYSKLKLYILPCVYSFKHTAC